MSARYAHSATARAAKHGRPSMGTTVLLSTGQRVQFTGRMSPKQAVAAAMQLSRGGR